MTVDCASRRAIRPHRHINRRENGHAASGFCSTSPAKADRYAYRLLACPE
ncbi:hypothetical protein KCP73_13725 [Salmonella enterica subsp. enterica]|nr:hypothetical protein KCP73_13725 [Salmonella enterica subsp. enterica]